MVGVVLVNDGDRVLQDLAIVGPATVVEAIYPRRHNLASAKRSLGVFGIWFNQFDVANAKGS